MGDTGENANRERWATIRRRAYLTLPWVGALMVAYGITNETTAALWIGLVGAAIGPAQGLVAAAHVEPKPHSIGNQS